MFKNKKEVVITNTDSIADPIVESKAFRDYLNYFKIPNFNTPLFQAVLLGLFLVSAVSAVYFYNQ